MPSRSLFNTRIRVVARVLVLLVGLPVSVALTGLSSPGKKPHRAGPAVTSSASDSDPGLIGYGKELIAHTATYLGPRGKVARLSNGMNCPNCHLDAGTQTWGNT